MSGIQNIVTLTALTSGTLNVNVSKVPSAGLDPATTARVTGTVTLVGSLAVAGSGTPTKNTNVKVIWEAVVTPAGNTVTIFGKTVPTEMVASDFVADCTYNGTSWNVSLLPDAGSTGVLGTAVIADDAVTTAKIADDAVTLAKMEGQTDGKILIGDTAAGMTAYLISGDATMIKGGTLTIAANAITTAKITDANVTPAKLSTSANKGQFAVQLEFDEAAKVGVIKYQICSTCTIDGIYTTVNRVPATDTATVIPKNHGGVAMTGGQIDITTALALGNIVSVTPTANNTFTAGEQMTLETSKTTKEACTITVMVCYTVTA